MCAKTKKKLVLATLSTSFDARKSASELLDFNQLLYLFD